MNTEIDGLLQKANASMNAAVLLHREGYHDFAASRVYYAMFYVAEAMLLQKGLSFSSHSAVIAAFGKEFAKTGIIDAKYHRYLISTERLRTVGDYTIGPSLEIAEVDLAFERAYELISAVQQILSENSGA